MTQRLAVLVLLVPLAALSGGCAALTNPVADGVPVRELPDELFPRPREELKPIPLTALRQPPAEEYKLGPGDVLGVYIETLLGEKGVPPPVRMPETGNQQPAIGYPIPVQPNGAIVLPFADPIPVSGMTLDQAREAVRVAITIKKEILPKDKPVRIFLTLIRPRTHHVVVVRQDGGSVSVSDTGILGGNRQGSGYPLDLPEGENDLLNALARTGGLPGLQAVDTVLIQRNSPAGGAAARAPLNQYPPLGETVRVPLRLRPGDQLPFRPEDVVLRTGDIVFIESRDTEVFYTAGLLPPAEHILPRDYDLDVVEAVARVHGPLVNGGFNQNNQFSSQLLASGLGFPSPALVNVLRKTSGGRQVNIRVDLNRAMKDPRERILIQPGDVLVMQERPCDALVRYFTSILRFNFFLNTIRAGDLTGTATASGP